MSAEQRQYTDAEIGRVLDAVDALDTWQDNMVAVGVTAIDTVVAVMTAGHEVYPDEQWLRQTPAVHVAHALGHLTMVVRGDDSEPHLEHALTRLAMAVTLTQSPQ